MRPSLAPTTRPEDWEALLEPPRHETHVGNHFVANYPPFSQWDASYLADFTDALKFESPPGPMGLYIHLPFCRQRCHYCYFRVYPRRTDRDVAEYIDAILNELPLYQQFAAIRGRAPASVYFGGGSPSFLGIEALEKLFSGLQTQVSWESVQECTFECEPGTVTLEKLRLLKACGVTRVSLGFQSLNNEVLRRSGRNVRVSDCLRAFDQARNAGFGEINIDLLAGLEKETDETWHRTIDQVLKLRPECITAYQFELTHNSRLYSSMQQGRTISLPDWSQKQRWVNEAFDRLADAGYTIASGYMAVREPERWRFVYTVEHFWRNTDLLALGETAFGHFQGFHYQNTDTFERYTQMVSEGRLPLRRARFLSPEEKLRREVILQLKTGYLDRNYFKHKYSEDLLDHFKHQFPALCERGLAEIDETSIRLTRKGLLQVDRLLLMFYLPEHRHVRYT